jgi:hypothetical protein
MTKWCEELWNKIDDENYFLKRNDGFVMFSTKTVGLLTPHSKDVLTKYAKIQKLKILEFMKNVEDINY